MPTITSVIQAKITNFGPLTTTYTAPASCATATNHLYLAGYGDKPEYLWAYPTCTMQLYGKCIPSGDQYDHLITATYAKTFDIGFYHYYSPGLYCPSNWTTAGKYVKGNGGTAQISGDLTKTESGIVPARWEPGRPIPTDPTIVWKQVLEPSETLAVCCPSDYTVDFNGNCYSLLGPMSSYGYTEICGYQKPTSVIPMTSMRGDSPVQIYTQPIPLATFTRDLQTGELQGANMVVTRVPAVALIHQESDFTKASEEDSTKENSANRMNERSHAMALLTMAIITTLVIYGL
ncbi:hypothetical protein FOC1_g10002412 [Fusarium oxysporum f. sp. cubense race 1]|uniref:Uncharacterized protein n=1 Tax=Fusarium oxysporum f. sp. cubense (strain race 1) TaxID=1229664 RepID=N4UC59_FUSC1|nr:hypothetical protein FOC1_g10002412 [Fusarium oxysporum f. sp. cubense race 1]